MRSSKQFREPGAPVSRGKSDGTGGGRFTRDHWGHRLLSLKPSAWHLDSRGPGTKNPRGLSSAGKQERFLQAEGDTDPCSCPGSCSPGTGEARRSCSLSVNLTQEQ